MSNNTQIRVYYLGAGEIGLPTLDVLRQDRRIKLVGVGTQPDRPAGRKRQLRPTPVGQYCQDNDIAVDKTENVNDPDFIKKLQALTLDFIIVFSFGQLLKMAVLELPKWGCFNVHTSLLPRHRGASPIVSSILAGDLETGVSFMRMNRGLDTGPVYERHKLQIGTAESAGELELRLANLSAEKICNCLCAITHDEVTATEQDNEAATYAPKLKKKDGEIDWNQPADELIKKVYAFNPYPKAYFIIKGKKRDRRIQIISAEPTKVAVEKTVPGQILQADKHDFIICCANNSAIRLTTIIPDGRREMQSDEFLRGCPLSAGTILT